ncbi:hypothetical protein BU15DRAFT_62511 [Melanogaster broomeanus]|nr:hypothetical protein BU15DRAFT_62511 [Melanogaster broomeanus]
MHKRFTAGGKMSMMLNSKNANLKYPSHARTPPPAGFVAIGDEIYISLAPTNGAATNKSAPHVILIFGWLGAQTRHLQNYTRPYAELYPNATQILVKCSPSFIYTSERGKKKRLFPVVDALEALDCLPAGTASVKDVNRVRPRVLIHAFSDGNIRTINAAFSIAVPNLVARSSILAFICIVHVTHICLSMAFGKEMMMMEYLKMQLLRPRLLPWMNAGTPRLYIFSKKDELVPWEEVQQHAESGKTAGLNVRCELFEESGHVAHVRLDPKRYWASVQDVWEVACCEGHSEGADSAVNLKKTKNEG